MKKKLLISGLGGSLFPYLHDQLKINYDLYYVDNNINLKKIYPDFNFFHAPKVIDPNYKEFVSQIIQKYKIDVYIPLIDEEILKAHEIKKDFTELFLFSPRFDFSQICLNKYDLMIDLKAKNLSSIESYTGDIFNWKNQTSVFVKPIFGRGSRGIRLINSPIELAAYYSLEKILPKHLLIQENVEGVEYTVGLLTNKRNQVLSITPKKVISKKGITIESVIANDQDIIELCKKINNQYSPQGAINIQLYRTANNDLKVFEINPRFSTTSIMSYASGIDEISLLLQYWDKDFNQDPQLAKPGLRLIRRWENLFYEN